MGVARGVQSTTTTVVVVEVEDIWVSSSAMPPLCGGALSRFDQWHIQARTIAQSGATTGALFFGLAELPADLVPF